MSTSINPTTNNPAADLTSSASPDANAAPVAYMSPDNIIEYVEKTLGNIDGQLADYQNDAMEKNKTANGWRDYKKLARDHADKPLSTEQPARDQELAQIKADFAQFENCSDPELKKAGLDLESKLLPPHTDRTQPTGPDFSAYPDTDAGRGSARAAFQGAVNGYNQSLEQNHPAGITKDDATARGQTADEALQTLNQDNELTLMRLNTLMQQRVQVTTKGSDQLSSLNQCIQAILQNMRS